MVDAALLQLITSTCNLHPSQVMIHFNAAIAQKGLGLSLQTAAIILGGGAGSRLYPLTKQRAKPAVPIGGAYRLIDVPMSNCINSGISKIYVLTQFNSTSLNRHLARTYNFGNGVSGPQQQDLYGPADSHTSDVHWCRSC